MATWVTRERLKTDRIACPWLIKNFIDRDAEFLYVPADAVLDVAAREIVEHVTRTGAKVVGPVPLPTERRLYTVIRSPHKYKDSREHFQMLTHKRLIDITDATSKTVQELQRLNLSAGVDIEIKL